MSPNGILCSQCNIYLTWNIGGLPVFSSSKFSLWPCYLVVNELPYRLDCWKRTSQLVDYEKKPNMHVYLKPIIGEFIVLERHGIEVQSLSVSHPCVSKVFLLAGTCTLPAKCLMLNTIQFNGVFRCSKWWSNWAIWIFWTVWVNIQRHWLEMKGQIEGMHSPQSRCTMRKQL